MKSKLTNIDAIELARMDLLELPVVSDQLKLTVKPGWLGGDTFHGIKQHVVETCENRNSKVAAIGSVNGKLFLRLNNNEKHILDDHRFNRVCEICGKNGEIVLVAGVMFTACDKHAASLNLHDEWEIDNALASKIHSRYWDKIVCDNSQMLTKMIDNKRSPVGPPAPGHFDLVKHLCRELNKSSCSPVFDDIKYCRDGSISFYCSFSGDDFEEAGSDIIQMAEELSLEICQHCGEMKDITGECCDDKF